MNETLDIVAARALSRFSCGRLWGALAFAAAGTVLTLGACSSDEGPAQVAGNDEDGGGPSSSSSGTPGTSGGADSGTSSSSSSGGGGPVQGACVSVKHRGVEIGYSEGAFMRFDAPCDTAHSKASAASEAGAQSLGSCWFRPLVLEDNAPSPSAGTITMTGTNPELDPYVTEYSGSNQYFPNQMEPFFNGESETTVAVTASGAEVPAFSGTLRIAGRTPLTLPQSTPEGFQVLRSADTVLTWPPTRAGQRVVFHAEQFTSPDQNAEARTITCEFDGTAGTGTVPKELLAQLQLDAVSGDSHVDIRVEDHSVVTAGRFEVTLEGVQYLLDSTLDPYSRRILTVTE